MRFLLCFVLICYALAPSAWAKAPEAYAGFSKISLDHETPHVAWAERLEGGPIRTLFIAPRFTMRDVVELAQRIELDYDIVPVWDANHVGWDKAPEGPSIPGASTEETLTSLYEHIVKDYDLIVVGGLDASMLPEAFFEAVVEKVVGGVGLLLAHNRGKFPARFEEFLNDLAPSDEAAAITRGIGETITPEWPTSLAFVKASVFEQGRVVQLDYPGEHPFTHFLAPPLTGPLRARPEYFDTYLSLVARAARWAAGRDPSIWITRIEESRLEGPPEEEIPPGLPEEYVQEMRDHVVRRPFQLYVVHFSQPAQKRYRIVAQVREPSRNLQSLYPELPHLSKGQNSYPLELPIGPGTYFLDLWIIDKKDVVEWHTEAITVKGWPEFSDLTFSKGLLLPNDTLTVSLKVRPLYHWPRACTVCVRATDSLGRLVAERVERVGIEGGPVQVVVGFVDLIANLVKVEVFVADSPDLNLTQWDLNQAAYGCLHLPVRAPIPANEFSFAVEARAVSEYNARGFLKTLAGIGVDSVCAAATDGARFHLAENNLRPIPELARYTPDSVLDAVREPCLSDPAYREAEAARIKDKATGFWTVGSLVYSLGRGNCLAAGDEDVCRSRHCLKGFRSWLREQYGSLASLNKAWGSLFGSWDSVEPGTRDAARSSGMYAPWLDFRLYMDTVFSGIHVAGRDVVRSVDVDGRVGFRPVAGSSAYLGYDWWLLASQLDALAVPPGPVLVEKLRSYRPAGSYAALCFGGEFAAPTFTEARWLPWRQALHGIPAASCAAPYGGAELETANVALMPDGRPSPLLLEAAQQIAELKTGIGTLLVKAERKKPLIAIYGSQSSSYLNQLDRTFGSGSRHAEAAFVRLIEGLGRQHDFVSYAEGIHGKLEEYALVVLPMVRSLSDSEVEAIRQFSAQGGHIIADIAPGRFDEHGVPRDTLPLDDLFGIRRAGPIRAGEAADATVTIPTSEDSTTTATLRGISPDTSVECMMGIHGGTAGEAPVWILRQDGERVTVLINHPLSVCLEQEDAALYRLFGGLFELAGIQRATPAGPAEGRVFNGECVALQYGNADIVALLAAPHGQRKVQRLTLRFNDCEAAYDMRQGKPAPRPKKIRVKLRKGDAAVYAALPYRVTELSLVTPFEVAAGSRLPVSVGVRTDRELPGKHLVHLTIARGFGDPIPYYTRNLVCARGQGRTYIPLALDERPGTYTMTARDVLTGVSAQTAVKVTPRIRSR